HRFAFGSVLADAPAMTAVLADLALESEAATWLAMRLAAAVDAGERALLRLALPAAEYYVCQRGPTAVREGLECPGRNRFVEASGWPSLYREAPLNSIWEGSGNVPALDVLRALAREPAAVDAVFAEISLGAGADGRLDAAASNLRRELLSAGGVQPTTARRL